MERDIIDLHGDTYIKGDYKISGGFPHKFTKDSKLVLDRDIKSNTSFILVVFTDGVNYGYIYYSNYVYVYGYLKHIDYNKKKDIRHAKG